MSLLLISGSLRDGSTNTALLRTAQAIDPDTELFAGMGALPHFSPDDDGDDLPAAVAELRAAVGRVDGDPRLHARVRRRAARRVQEPPGVARRRRGGLPQADRVDQRLRPRGALRRGRRARLAAQGRRVHEHGDRRGGLRAHPGGARRHRRRTASSPTRPSASRWPPGARAALREGAARVRDALVGQPRDRHVHAARRGRARPRPRAARAGARPWPASRRRARRDATGRSGPRTRRGPRRPGAARRARRRRRRARSPAGSRARGRGCARGWPSARR